MGNSSKKDKKVLRDEIKELKDSIMTLSLENSEMHENLECIMTSEPEIVTFQNGKYTDDIRACIYELLSLNVGVKNIGPIIRCVIDNLTHKSIKRLPSYGLTCQMILESLTIVQAQLGDELSENNFTTLQTDGTTKFGEHFATYDITVAAQAESKTTYCLGLRHVFSGSSQDTLDTFKQILGDIDCVHLLIGKEAVSSKIVLQIKNTMSDRHAAEKLFNELLADFREEILPSVVENWTSLDEVEKEQLTRLHNFFCGLHFLVGLATCADETVKLWEVNYSGAMGTSQAGAASSSGTQQLVRTVCKALHHHGSQQSGSSVLFRSFLRKKGIMKIPLAEFVGNRFNILFYDAVGTYHLSELIIEFIESVHSHKANRLLQSVLRGLKKPMFIAGCRALGFINKVVTGPLWRTLEESTTSILKISSTYSQMKLKFDSWALDSSEFITGSSLCITDSPVHEDDVWRTLVRSNSTDGATQELLQLVFQSFSVITQRLLIDHLPGGIYYDVTNDEVLVNEMASVPCTNTSPERDFAVMDRLLREKPNAHFIALETMILFAHNKTSHWLSNLSEAERSKLIETARALAPSFRAKYKTRRQELEARRADAMEKRIQDNTRRELAAFKEKESLTKEIESIGLWSSKDEVENGLEKLRNQGMKKNALKVQISFRYKVLNQVHSNQGLFKFSRNRKQLSVSELKENLLILIGAASDGGAAEGLDSEDSIVTYIHSRSDQEAPPPVMQCHTDQDSIDHVLLNPDKLVGRRIKHRFEVNNELVWFTGTLLSMNERREYSVEYDGEEDICLFTLLDDLSSGDLLLL